MDRTRKKYEELTITDDFMFGKVIRDSARCRKLLEIMLGVKIREIVFLDDQHTKVPDYRAKGIRIDVYVEDNANTVYTVEMQVRNLGDLPMRSRYYQSIVDISLIERGMDYKLLKKNYIIFICAFDPFGRGRHIYHFEDLCREDPTLRLEDGTEKIFLNINGISKADAPLDGMDEELLRLLKYLESQTPQDAFTKELDQAVADAKLHKEWRREYMTLERLIMEGRSEGRAEGLAEGRAEGEIKKLVHQICRKLAKGKTPEAIADDLEEDLDKVRHICDTAAKYAPDYDIGKILTEILADR